MFGKNSGVVCLRFTVAIMLASVAAPAIAMTAYSIRDMEHIDEGGKKFWQIRVTCTDWNIKRFIVRSQEKGPWCAKQLPNFCSDNKVQLAVNVCSRAYTTEMALKKDKEIESQENLVAQDKQNASNKSVLLEEQALIHSQRVELAERKRDLRRREIDLQKREIEMRNRIANLH